MRKLLVLLVAGIAMQAHASHTLDLQLVDEELKSCLHQDSSNSGMKLCVYEASLAADRVLNRVYQEMLKSLRSPSQDSQVDNDRKEVLKRLVAAQRAWIPYRDAKCELDAIGSLGGTMESLELLDCNYRTTSKRVHELVTTQELLP